MFYANATIFICFILLVDFDDRWHFRCAFVCVFFYFFSCLYVYVEMNRFRFFFSQTTTRKLFPIFSHCVFFPLFMLYFLLFLFELVSIFCFLIPFLVHFFFYWYVEHDFFFNIYDIFLYTPIFAFDFGLYFDLIGQKNLFLAIQMKNFDCKLYATFSAIDDCDHFNLLLFIGSVQFFDWAIFTKSIRFKYMFMYSPESLLFVKRIHTSFLFVVFMYVCISRLFRLVCNLPKWLWKEKGIYTQCPTNVVCTYVDMKMFCYLRADSNWIFFYYCTMYIYIKQKPDTNRRLLFNCYYIYYENV